MRIDERWEGGGSVVLGVNGEKEARGLWLSASSRYLLDKRPVRRVHAFAEPSRPHPSLHGSVQC